MTPVVLVLEGERDLGVTYERLLRRRGYRVVLADSRHEGLSVVQASPVALVVSELWLPDGSALDVVRAARAAAPGTPAVVVTNAPSLESRQAALAAGAEGFLAKPFTVADFTRLIDRMTKPRSG